MKRYLIFMGLMAAFSPVLFAQHTHPLSPSPPEALKKVQNITEKAKEWSGINIDSTITYARLGLLMASQLNEPEIMRTNLTLLGDSFTQLGEFDGALDVYNQASQIITASNNKNSTILLLNAKGNVLSELGQYAKAIDHHQQAKKLATDLDDITLVTHSLVCLGKVYQKQDKSTLALQIQLEAIRLAKENNLDFLQSVSLKEVALAYEKLGQLDKAIQYFEEALVIESEKNNEKQVASILNALSGTYQQGRKPQHSIENAEKALAIAQKNNDFENAALACDNLSKCFRMLKDFKKSLKYQQLSDDFKNQLFRIERQRLVTALKANFEISKKELENHLLKEKEIILEKDLKRQMLLIIFFCLALILASALAFSFYLFNKNKQKSNHFLQQQNEAIKNQKQQLEDVLQRLKLTQSQLIQSEKMASIGQLTAGIAHEINNPVNFIYTGIAGLKKNLNALMKIVEKYDGLEKKEDVEKIILAINQLKTDLNYEEILSDITGLMESIEDGAERTGGIVRSLRTFSHIDAKELNAVDIHQNLDSTLVLLNYQLKDRILLEKQYAEQLPKVESFNGQLNQVFMNILTNAIQAIGEQTGKISIKTEAAGDNVLISITDTGVGIGKEDIKHLFNPFYTTKEVGEGTGLGLSISYGIIQKHQGTIKVNSQKGKGTEMMLTIPKRQKTKSL